MSIMKYSYYDSPDGKDLAKKLFYTNKNVTIIGFGLATTDIILNSKPKGYLQTLLRYGQLMTPMWAVTSTFCIVTYASTRLRDKDDVKNYGLGGFASGLMLGVFTKSYLNATWIGVIACLAAMAKKNAKLNNYEIMPTIPTTRHQQHGDFRTPYKNWTVYEERPKGWVAAEERAQ
ncbi:uncharacterized protein LOC126846497 [Adelges cooleyi]|uniref:uncharacterized protein LOC126846497 n=1 Tax=Adelges cooleyi TaxID=133065 RepID=UPI0021808A76|nr:uncharacterized protein LOC126846497 [Adelges cooleyi]